MSNVNISIMQFMAQSSISIFQILAITIICIGAVTTLFYHIFTPKPQNTGQSYIRPTREVQLSEEQNPHEKDELSESISSVESRRFHLTPRNAAADTIGYSIRENSNLTSTHQYRLSHKSEMKDFSNLEKSTNVSRSVDSYSENDVEEEGGGRSNPMRWSLFLCKPQFYQV